MTLKKLQDFTKRVKELFERKQIHCPVHLSGGNELQLIEVFQQIKRTDYVFSTHRNHYHALLHGIPANTLIKYMVKDSISMNIQSPKHRFYATAIVGGGCAIAAGVAWALKEKESKQRVWCFVGDGAIDGGHFWEAFQFVEGWDLPLTFVVENNNRSTTTSIAERLGDDLHNTHLLLAKQSDKVIWYDYIPTEKHVGIGKYVAF
jgi:TPP-dependent pyruvate/acetoin dehydrogenase alpha subunit